MGDRVYVSFLILIAFHRLVQSISDDRIKKTRELIQGMKLLKVSGWERIFVEKIQQIRSKERSPLKNDTVFVAINSEYELFYFGHRKGWDWLSRFRVAPDLHWITWILAFIPLLDGQADEGYSRNQYCVDSNSFAFPIHVQSEFTSYLPRSRSFF